MDRLKPLPLLITGRAQKSPNAVAIESISTDEQITWQEFDQNCRRWADAFRRLKVNAHDCVATMMPNTPEAIYAWLGCGWLRAVECPINTDFRGEWLTHALNNSQARVVVISRQFARWLALVTDALEHLRLVVVYDGELRDEVETLAHLRVVTGEEFFADAQPAEGLPDPQLWDIEDIIYTSGTTGRSKAVVQPWGMLEHSRRLFSAPEFQDCTFYGFWPPYHSLGKSVLFPVVANNGKLVMRERFSVGEFWNDIRKFGCSGSYVVSVVANFLYSQPARDDDADNPLKAVIMAPVISQVDDFKRRFGVNVYTAFGSSEIGTAFYSDMREVNGSNWKSCGRIPADALLETAIADDKDFPVGPGQIGELIVRPKLPWTFNLGYLNMPEETARVWRNGWFHTGDSFVYDDDGEHYFVDRAKDYIRRRGENISSFEVESAICSFPGVAQTAVVAVQANIGEDEVMAFVVSESGASLDPVNLLEFLTDRVPSFAVPRYIECVDALPVTQATFRVQKHKLRELGPGPNTFDRMDPARMNVVGNDD